VAGSTLSRYRPLIGSTNSPLMKLRTWSRSVRMQSENKRILEGSRIARAHWVQAVLAFGWAARAFAATPIQQRQGREYEVNGHTSMAFDSASQIKPQACRIVIVRRGSSIINCGPTMSRNRLASSVPTAKNACLLPKPAWQRGLNHPYECTNQFYDYSYE